MIFLVGGDYEVSVPQAYFSVGVLIQIKEALQPDGLFLGAMLGGETLFELR